MEVLHADDTLLVTQNTRTMNRLLHAVESESQYHGLKLNQSKCAAIASTGRHRIKFRDGTPVPHEDQVTCLGGIITRQVNIRAEIENRIAATMATWRWMHVSFKNSSCPIRWTLIVYNSMVRSKLIVVWSGHPRDTPGTPIKTWSLPVERFTKNINVNTTYIDRRNTNAEVYRRANLAIKTRQGNDTTLTWTIRQCIEEKRIKLTGHLLRADDSYPMRQVSFQNNSASPYLPLFRRPGRPPKNWMISSLELCWNNTTIPLIRTPLSSNGSSWLKQGKDSSNRVFCHLVMAFAIIRYSFRQPAVAFANIRNSVSDVGA